jgi:1-acyl-sn-glycerol-3-phosphate acyltransferase
MTFYGFAKAVVGVALRTVWRMRVHGAELVPRDGPLIVACNHVSYFDPPALGVAMPRPIHYMAKVELFAMPVLGPVIARLNAFPVDRSRGDVAALGRPGATGVRRGLRESEPAGADRRCVRGAGPLWRPGESEP